MNYQYIIPIVIILFLVYYFCKEKPDTDYLKAFQQVKGDMETTVFVFNGPCDKTKYTTYGMERNIKTNKGAGFVNQDYTDVNGYITLADRKELVNELIKDNWIEVYKIMNSDGKVHNVGEFKEHLFNDFDKLKCK